MITSFAFRLEKSWLRDLFIVLFCSQLEDCALQLYKHNGSHCEYGVYLDLESSLSEQSDELEGFTEKLVQNLSKAVSSG